MVFPVVMYGYESLTINRLSAEELMLSNDHHRLSAEELML